jgi:hypothetical protein
MAETETPSNQLPLHSEVRYEHSDITGRTVVLLGTGILIGTWIFVWLLYYFYAYLMQSRAEAGPPAAERASGKVLVPPEPRIQSSPSSDLRAMRASEDTQLNSYGWVDRPNGIVSIPIESAIQLTAQRGIPPQRSALSTNVCAAQSPTWQAGVGGIADPKMLCPPKAGTRETGFEGKVEPEPR